MKIIFQSKAMILKLISCFFLLLLTHLKIYSQDINIMGKIIDDESKQELPFSTIEIGNNKSLSNNKGFFNLLTNKDTLNKYGIDISYIGFKNKHVQNNLEGNFNFIRLEKVDMKLPEVFVSIGGKKIVEKAIGNIVLNYPIEPFNILGFQRSYEVTNDSFFYKDDALLNVYYSSYLRKKIPIQVQVLQNRSLMKGDNLNKQEQKDLLEWKGTYSLIAGMDIVYNKLFFIDLNKIDMYSFQLKKKTNFNNQRVYLIDFFTKDSLKQGIEGTLLIDTASYAFVDVTFFLNSKSKETAANENRSKDYFQLININYFKSHDKWRVKNFHAEAHLNKFKNKLNKYVATVADFVTLSTETTNVTPIKFVDRIGRNDKLSDIKIEADESKWRPIDSIILRKEFAKAITDIKTPSKK